MFNSIKNSNSTSKTPVKKGATVKDHAVTILTSGCHFQGKLYCRGSSRIAGKIEGHIVSEGLLIIEEEAIVKADIVADEIVVQGRVIGKIEAKTRLELCPSSQFEGDLYTSNLSVHEGARFSGKAFMPSRESMHGVDNALKDGNEKEKQLFTPQHSTKLEAVQSEAARMLNDLEPAGSSSY